MITNNKDVFIITSGCAVNYEKYDKKESEPDSICDICDPVKNPMCNRCIGA
jgi:hypothetical protein